MNVLTPERAKEINQQSVDRSDMFYWQTNRPMTMEEGSLIFGESRKNISNSELIGQLIMALGTNPDYQGVRVETVEGGEQYTFGSVNINRNFVLSDGRQVVGRFHPKGLRNGYFSAEAAIAKRARRYGVPVATPLAVRYAQSDNEMDCAIFEKVPGSNMKQWIEDHTEDEERLLYGVGALMARIHEIPVEGYGFFDNDLAQKEGQLRGIHRSYRDHVLAGLRADLLEITDAGWVTGNQAAKITHLLEKSDLLKCEDPRLIHNDLADWNVIVDGSDTLTAIDWDEAHAGDPVADIACWSLFFPSARLSKLLEGYRATRALPSDFEERLHVYRLRYVVSKLALRHKKYFYNKTDFMKEAIKIGRQAFADESAHFGFDNIR